MAERKILVSLALVSAIISIQPATAQTTIEVSPPVTIEINPGPAIVYAPMPYGLRQSDMTRENLTTRGLDDVLSVLNIQVCRAQVPMSLQIGSAQYQVFMQQCVAEMARKY